MLTTIPIAGFKHLFLRQVKRLMVWWLGLMALWGIMSSAAWAVAPVTKIVAGYAHSCSLHNDGTVMCWGENTKGQLGNGNTTNSNVPVAVTGLTGITAITSASGYTCAIDGSGAAKCWGENTYGQLGNGSTTNSNVPVAVTGLTGVTAIAAGGGHTCAIDGVGAMKCWGNNSIG